MEGVKNGITTQPNEDSLLLNMVKPSALTYFNRVFAAAYACAILALFYYHARTLLLSMINSTSPSFGSFSITLFLFISDLVLAFMWTNTQAFRMFPVYRKEFPENLEKAVKRSDFPALDVFICTADPEKEPPMGVVNTALSVMGYDYPAEKLSVFVSDDGGSAFTLFAFMEGAKFAGHWLPFCRENNLVVRSPEIYFQSNHPFSPEAEKIKVMYEGMKVKVERALELGKIDDEYITTQQELAAFNKWATHNFTKQNHPAVVQVLLDNSKDKDFKGDSMPNLIYVSREKRKTSAHHFKAGALNALLRVSATMTNAPIVLTLDCDFYSNDPRTALRVLCYMCDPALQPELGYVQFPQRFQGINKNDIYAGELRRLFTIHPMGMDGLMGPNYVGTGCFFRRRALFGSPSTFVSPEMPEVSPDHAISTPIQSHPISALAHQVASCNYENQTNWGSKIGFRYGSLVEDFYTGYRLQCEGWRSLFCNPERAAFYGDTPVSFIDVLGQQERWAVGLLEVVFHRQNPLRFGVKAMGLLMGLMYSHYALWPISCIPITTYALLPQLALLNNVYTFPKVSEPLFFLYIFLFVGAYAQDCVEFLLNGGTVGRWWSDQRIWQARGVTCYLFGTIEFLLQHLGVSAFGFNVTSKVLDDEQSKKYEQGIFEFGAHSPMFVALTLVAIVNFVSFAYGLAELFRGNNLERQFLQVCLAGFVVVNCLPIYEAMVLRSDKGKLPAKTTITGAVLACAFYVAISLILKFNCLSTTQSNQDNPGLLNMVKPSAFTYFNRVFAAAYDCAILALFYYHARTLLLSMINSTSPSFGSFSITLFLFISDLVLAFMWTNTQAFRMFPVYRKEFPENLEKAVKRSDFPALDVFICTADPEKEPPMGVVNTALSVMGYDYPAEKLSVFVSDDGGSAFTVFAFMEGAKFAGHWLPFCRENNIVERSPEVYFQSNHPFSPGAEKIKVMYEGMKVKVERALELGKIDDECITTEQERAAFNKWATHNFTKQNHPAVVQIIARTKTLKVIRCQTSSLSQERNARLPPTTSKLEPLMLWYTLSQLFNHNAPMILTLDCDFHSNDPKTPLRALCYMCDPAIQPKLGYVQFPQRFQGINRNDIYAGKLRRLLAIQVRGLDGLIGPNYMGTGCFFRRRIGFRYGSLVEDFYTGYWLHCEGWRSVFCNPERAAFYGETPVIFFDVLDQQKRWAVGLLEVVFHRHNPLTFGVKAMGLLMGLMYSFYSFWSLWCIPITTYALLPHLALLNNVYVFPKVSEPLFFLYVFLFLGAYSQDFVEFILSGGTVGRWWSDQRFWLIRGVTCYLFGTIEFLLQHLGVSAFGFNVTSKVLDDEQSKKYEQGIFEFGAHSPMFVALTLVAIINFVSFAYGLAQVFRSDNLERSFLQ
ncbi:hypothetical protein Tsubulata_032635, partial [Turnera subulata]